MINYINSRPLTKKVLARMSCPYCGIWGKLDSDGINDLNIRYKKDIFKLLHHTNCPKCGLIYYYVNFANSNRRGSITGETYDNLLKIYNHHHLHSYLPTDNLKRTYQDCKRIIASDVSINAKMGTLRPLIEAFLNERTSTTEDNDIRKTVSKLNNKELEKALHKVIDDTLKGVHIKVLKIKNNPDEVILFLEILFTKIYKMPIEKRKLEQHSKVLDRELEKQMLLIKK